MIFTNMRPQHIAQVAALEKVCFGSAAWSENSIATELENPLALWIVADDDGKVLGYVGSQTVMDETDMMNIAQFILLLFFSSISESFFSLISKSNCSFKSLLLSCKAKICFS